MKLNKTVVKLVQVFFLIGVVSFFIGISAPPMFVFNKEKSVITYQVPIYFTQRYSSQWYYIKRELKHGNYQTVILVWQGGGGYVDDGLDFIDAVQVAEGLGKKVIFDIIGHSWSMHANVICYASDVRFESYGALYFHHIKDHGTERYSTDKGGLELQDEIFATCKQAGYLTDRDIYEITHNYKAVRVKPGEKHKVIEDI